jgi:hypothetical protein
MNWSWVILCWFPTPQNAMHVSALASRNLEKPFQRGWENPLFQLDEDSASVSLLHEGGVFTSSLGEAVASFLFWSKPRSLPCQQYLFFLLR